MSEELRALALREPGPAGTPLPPHIQAAVNAQRDDQAFAREYEPLAAFAAEEGITREIALRRALRMRIAVQRGGFWYVRRVQP